MDTIWKSMTTVAAVMIVSASASAQSSGYINLLKDRSLSQWMTEAGNPVDSVRKHLTATSVLLAVDWHLQFGTLAA